MSQEAGRVPPTNGGTPPTKMCTSRVLFQILVSGNFCGKRGTGHAIHHFFSPKSGDAKRTRKRVEKVRLRSKKKREQIGEKENNTGT